jgi:AsmA-like C-terminal region
VVARPFWQGVAALALLAAVVAVGLFGAVIWLGRPESLRARAVAALSRDLESEVSLDALETSLRPGPRMVLRGLVVRHRGRRDVPPLIQIRSLTVDVSLTGWRAHRLDHVDVDGLQIFIPPRTDDAPRTDDTTAKRETAPPPVGEWYIDRLTATDASLRIGVREPGKPPREFYIHHLAMSSVGADRAMTFNAALTNPKPVGEIKSTGTFGPWQKDSPSLTPLEGTYTFSNADLATFKGIAGILTSNGRYGGVLERIEADGSTATPDFRLSVGGNPVSLTTHYQAVIDGTNGNTVLKRIDAVLGQTQMSVSGAVIGIKGVEGRTITLDVDIPNGRLEDLLRLAVKGPSPPLTGRIVVKTNIRIPPGDRDVVDKLQLDGRFRIVAARFNSLNIQRKLDELSRRGRGRPDEEHGGQAVSNMSGPFTLKDTAMTFPRLTFGVPGATVRLSGRYHMRRETLDFMGTLSLQATVSQTVTGIKRWLLKPVDPLFARDGMGTVLPIRIGGTRSDPAFSLDVKSAIKRRDPS